MTHTPTSTQNTLFGAFLIALGLFGGQIVLTTSPELQARLVPKVPTHSGPVSPAVRKAVRPKVKVPKAKVSVREIRQRAASGAATSVLPVVAPVYERARCGDKLTLLDETCDDGNAVAGDGCSASCQVETGFSCNGGQPSACWSSCGDGAIASNEQCDDGNFAGDDGCSARCKKEVGYTCTGTPSTCYVTPYCGNGIVEHGETCDDDNVDPNDGCSASCQTE